jgi:hypothetical protein
MAGAFIPAEEMIKALTALTGIPAYKYHAFELLVMLDLDVYQATRRLIVSRRPGVLQTAQGPTVRVLPKELLDAGRIDGCTEFGISVRIMMPIAKPAFASMAILCTMGAWNNVLWPMLIFREAKKFTLPIGLNSLLTPYGNNYDLLIAGSMFSILPLFIVFLCFQRYLIEGVTAGAVKG